MNLAVDHARGPLVRAHRRALPRPRGLRGTSGHAPAHRPLGRGRRPQGRSSATPSQGRAIAAVMGSPFAQGNSVYHYGEQAQAVDHIPFGAYPTALVRELGGWSPTQLVNEDFEFDHRVRTAGHELLFDPEIHIDWDCRQRVGRPVPPVPPLRRRQGADPGAAPRVGRRRATSPRPAWWARSPSSVPLLARRRTRLLGAAIVAPYAGAGRGGDGAHRGASWRIPPTASGSLRPSWPCTSVGVSASGRRRSRRPSAGAAPGTRRRSRRPDPGRPDLHDRGGAVP